MNNPADNLILEPNSDPSDQRYHLRLVEALSVVATSDLGNVAVPDLNTALIIATSAGDPAAWGGILDSGLWAVTPNFHRDLGTWAR